MKATCADADLYGCASITVKVGATVVATTSTATLDQTESLARFEGNNIELVFEAKDAAGVTASTKILPSCRTHGREG